MKILEVTRNLLPPHCKDPAAEINQLTSPSDRYYFYWLQDSRLREIEKDIKKVLRVQARNRLPGRSFRIDWVSIEHIEIACFL